MVTQTSRGELAVADVGTSPTDVVNTTLIKVDPRIPGYSFLPVGAVPSDVVADPMGKAVFVASGKAASETLARYLADRDWRHEVGTAIAPWHVRAAEASRAQPPLWTHGDWHVSNLCWSGDEDGATITDVLDFGLSARTFALFDLATAIERNAIAWLDIDKGPIARHDVALALIRGYRAIRPLSPSDLDALADVLPLVHLDFALSEVDYFEGITRRREHADVAYYTFLIGHAAWFAGTEGQGLLQAIRDAGR